MDIKENDKIEAKTGQNQAGNGKRRKVNQVKAKVKVEPVKTEHKTESVEKSKSTKVNRNSTPEKSKPPINSYSLRIGDEHLDTISKTESDEFIKSSVENLIPSLSESEDKCECDVPACGDFKTFFNLFFDADYDFSSSDNESFSNEDISKEIYSNPLFDEEIISMKIDPRYFNAGSDLIESLLNHDSSIISSSSKLILFLMTSPEEIRLIEILLYDNSSPRPPGEFISKKSDAAIESFSPSIPVEDSDALMEEIDLTLTPNDSMPNNSLSFPENESFHFDIPSSFRPPAKSPDDDEIKLNLGILTVKMVGDISEHDVPMQRILPTQPTLTSNQEKSLYLLSHRGLKAF
nr:hypothetical protein [Tanacetum cinerariifolium]